MARYLVQHATSGDTFVIEQDHAGATVAESDALYYADWQEPDTSPARPKAELDLYDVELETLDTPETDDAKYRYLAQQDAPDQPLRDLR